MINSLSSQCQKLSLWVEKYTVSHCLSILVITFMKSWWVLGRDAVDRSKILASRKPSLSRPTALESQTGKSLLLVKLQFIAQDIVLKLHFRIKLKESLQLSSLVFYFPMAWLFTVPHKNNLFRGIDYATFTQCIYLEAGQPLAPILCYQYHVIDLVQSDSTVLCWREAKSMSLLFLPFDELQHLDPIWLYYTKNYILSPLDSRRNIYILMDGLINWNILYI